jgi:hypothetical protein
MRALSFIQFISESSEYDDSSSLEGITIIGTPDSDFDINEISEFINFAKEFLNISDPVNIELTFDKTSDVRTTGYYNNRERRLKVYIKDRATVDTCRSIAHELVHHKQNVNGEISNAKEAGAVGSPIENEANAKAGEIIRLWGRRNPKIYE